MSSKLASSCLISTVFSDCGVKAGSFRCNNDASLLPIRVRAAVQCVRVAVRRVRKCPKVRLRPTLYVLSKPRPNLPHLQVLRVHPALSTYRLRLTAVCIFNMGDCCLKGFQWNAKPKGRDAKLGGRDCYVTGSNQSVAIMIIHDLYGWTFSNTRILADHYAQEVDATVYVPDL